MIFQDRGPDIGQQSDKVVLRQLPGKGDREKASRKGLRTGGRGRNQDPPARWAVELFHHINGTGILLLS